MATVADLLSPLTPDQQALIDCVAEAFVLDNDWPIYDYVEGTFDRAYKDAAEIIASCPRIGRWNYGAVWWVGMGQTTQPAAQGEIALTLLGLHHSSSSFQSLLERVFDALGAMVSTRRSAPLDRHVVRDVTITDRSIQDLFAYKRVVDPKSASEQVYKALAHEPYLGTYSPFPADGGWTMSVPRIINSYDDIGSIEAYLTCVERLTAFPPVAVTQAVPSPLDLVAALDYLDAVWRLLHERRHLFSYPSAERSAKLSLAANTAEEFDSRLSALGEILRSANAAAKASASERLGGSTHDQPLAPLSDYLAGLVGDDAKERMRQAVRTLERIISIRDAAQHTEASARAVRALTELQIGHPIVNIAGAWEIVTVRAVEALAAIREELAAIAS